MPEPLSGVYRHPAGTLTEPAARPEPAINMWTEYISIACIHVIENNRNWTSGTSAISPWKTSLSHIPAPTLYLHLHYTCTYTIPALTQGCWVIFLQQICCWCWQMSFSRAIRGRPRGCFPSTLPTRSQIALRTKCPKNLIFLHSSCVTSLG